MKKNLFLLFTGLLICACAHNIENNKSQDLLDDNTQDYNAYAKAIQSELNYQGNAESTEKKEKDYCSAIRRMKIVNIGPDYVITGECPKLLPDKVCVVPKAQHVYFKKKQLAKIDIKVIYDGLIFTFPEKKCAKFVDSYKYKTRLNNVSNLIFGEQEETTIPIAQIVSRY